MANTSISNLSAGAAVSATDLLPNVQTAGVGPVKTTAAQLKTFMSASPTLVTPALGVATGTSLALGGTPIGGYVFAVTGASQFDGGINAQAVSGIGYVQWTNGSGPYITSSSGNSLTFNDGTTTKSFILTAPSATATPAMQLGAADASSAIAQTLQFQSSTGAATTGPTSTIVLAGGVSASGAFQIQKKINGVATNILDWGVTTASAWSTSGNFQPSVDNSYQLGTGGNAWSVTNSRYYAATNVANVQISLNGAGNYGHISNIDAHTWQIGYGPSVATTGTSVIRWTDNGNINLTPFSAVQLGAPDASSAAAQTLQVQSVVAGTTNAAGADFSIYGSKSTGTGAGGSIKFYTSPAGSTGSAQNAGALAMTIDSTKLVTFANNLQGPSSWDLQANSSIRLYFNSTTFETYYFAPGDMRVANSVLLQWSSSANISGTMDTILSRKAAGILKVSSASTGGVINFDPVAVASLPAAATAGAGARGFVTDALTPVYGSTVTGGGAVKVPVYSDGTNWIVG